MTCHGGGLDWRSFELVQAGDSVMRLGLGGLNNDLCNDT